jgi:uncharacterized protein YdaT
MPWYNGNYPPSYKNQPERIRDKPVEIANNLLEKGAEEGVAIATGLKRASLFYMKSRKIDTSRPKASISRKGRD